MADPVVLITGETDVQGKADSADSDFLGHRPPHPKAFIPGSVSVKKSTISGAPAFASYLPKSFTPNSSVACGVRCGEGKKGAPNLKRVPGSPSARDDRAATRGALHRRQLGSWYMTGASRDSSSVSRATIHKFRPARSITPDSKTASGATIKIENTQRYREVLWLGTWIRTEIDGVRVASPGP
jgi:hypothetical protein